MKKSVTPTSRRKVISGIGAGALAATTGIAPSMAAIAKPNILFVMSDQEQATHYLSSLPRPNHDRLMKAGLTFRHSYVVDPVCSPSRAAVFTGLYPWETGVIGNVDIYQNAPALDPKYPTIGSVLQKAGYRTGYFGKWHLSWLVEDPILVPEDYNGGRRDQLKQFGFETSFIPTDSDDRPLGKRWDGEIARQSSAWIRDAMTKQEPWCAVVSLINPHDIPFGALYLDRQIPDYPVTLPKSWNQNMNAPGMPPELSAPRPTVSPKRFPGVMGVAPSSEAEWREYLRRYYYLLQDCDKNLGTILDALELSGGLENTVIIYTADHGEMGAAHGRGQKSVMYEEAVTVPLIISSPTLYKTAEVTERLSSNIDLAPTIAALAGVRWPRPLRGINLLRDQRDAVFSVAGTSPELSGLVKMIRVKDWKLVLFPSGSRQLFNLTEDPDEMNDLSKDPAHQKLLVELSERIAREII